MTPDEQKQADLDEIEKRRRRKEALLLLLLLGFYRFAENEVAGAVKDGADPIDAGNAAPDRFQLPTKLGNALAAVHIDAGETAVKQARPPQPAGAAWAPTKANVATEYQAFAGDVTTMVRQNVSRLIQDALDKVGPEAGDAANILATTMREAMDSKGYTAKNPAGARALAVTLVTKAWSSGAFAAWRSTGLWTLIKAFHYEAILDDRTTQICRHYDGTTLDRDHPWWLTHTPPCHWNCRSIVLPLWGTFTPTAAPAVPMPAAGFGLRADLGLGFSFNGTR